MAGDRFSLTPMGLFGKLFGSENAFQRKVLKLLQHHFPQINAVAGRRPLSILIDGKELDLAHLQERCRTHETQSEEFILQYFSFPIDFVKTARHSWNEAQLLIRPQIVPAEIARKFDLLLFPFDDTLATSIVIKDQKQQIFVRETNRKDWNVGNGEIYNTALMNLNGDPAEMEVTITDGTDRFIGLETHDGFDAARILTPKLRDFAVSKLGETYYAGLPNRNFLILWSVDCSARFQDYALEKIETDHAIQNYPLSSARFRVSNDSIRIL